MMLSAAAYLGCWDKSNDFQVFFLPIVSTNIGLFRWRIKNIIIIAIAFIYWHTITYFVSLVFKPRRLIFNHFDSFRRYPIDNISTNSILGTQGKQNVCMKWKFVSPPLDHILLENEYT